MFRHLPAPAILLLAVALGGCDSGPGSAPPVDAPPANVLLITVDTLRPDALGWIEEGKSTPAIDALAAEGFAFPAAVAPVPLTLPSHTSLMTGLHPFRHGVRDNGQIVPSTVVTLADRFRQHGYHTAAFVSGFTLKPEFGLDRGFEHYDSELDEGVEGWLERDAMTTTRAALAHMRTVDQPWFLWVHYFDPHDPYDPPAEYRLPGPRGSYDGEVAFTDAAIGRLRSELAQRGDGEVITVFASDHAESLGEHGEHGHGVFIYDTTLLVPLIFHAPERIKVALDHRHPRLVDIAPTLLGLLNLPPIEGTDGVDLGPLLAGEAQEIDPAYIESRMSWIAYGWAPLSGLREADWKFIQAPRPELYDLRADPGERNNRHDENIILADQMAATLDDLVAIGPVASETVQDQELLDRLRSLGYLSAGRHDAEPDANAPDPKDRDHERRLLEVAEAHLRVADYDRALALFAEVLEREPDNRFANLRTGITHLKAGNLEAAVPPLTRSVELDPNQAEARFALADALSRLGRTDAAIPQWFEVVRLQPRRVAGWANLGSLLAQDGQTDKAREALVRAFELDPANAGILANIVVLDRVAGTSEDTLARLLTIAREQGPSFAHHAALGLLLVGAGDMEGARPWLERASPGQHGYAEARWQLTLILGYGGEQAAAREALAEAVAANPDLRDRAQSHPLTRAWLTGQ